MKIRQLCKYLGSLMLILILSACGQSNDQNDALNTQNNQLSKDELEAEPPEQKPAMHTPSTAEWDATKVKTIEWTDLMPQDDLDALLSPPDYINDVQDGALEDQISSQLKGALSAAADDRYQQALISQRIKPEMNGQSIRLPGFIVPLEFDNAEAQTISEFFLVPYFGACIHVPPPPPNQIIYVSAPKGIERPSMYDPFWVSGVLRTEIVENEVATSAYSMEMQKLEVYDGE